MTFDDVVATLKKVLDEDMKRRRVTVKAEELTDEDATDGRIRFEVFESIPVIELNFTVEKEMTNLSKRLMATGVVGWREGMRNQSGSIFSSHGVFMGYRREPYIDEDGIEGFLHDAYTEEVSPDDLPDLSHAGTLALIKEQLEERLGFKFYIEHVPLEPVEFMMRALDRKGFEWGCMMAPTEAELLVKIAESIKETE